MFQSMSAAPDQSASGSADPADFKTPVFPRVKSGDSTSGLPDEPNRSSMYQNYIRDGNGPNSRVWVGGKLEAIDEHSLE